jgi:hypothetical protein
MKVQDIVEYTKKTSYVLLSTNEPDTAIAKLQGHIIENEKDILPIAIIPVIRQQNGEVALTYKVSANIYSTDPHTSKYFESQEEVIAYLLKLLQKTEDSLKVPMFILQQISEENDITLNPVFWNTLIVENRDFPQMFVIVGRNPKAPKLYSDYFHKLNIDLPDEEERKVELIETLKGTLETIYDRKFSKEEIEKALGEEKLEKIVKLGAGLTLKNFIDAVMLAIKPRTKGKEFKGFDVDLRKFIKVKEGIVKQHPALEIYHPEDNLPELIGFERARTLTEKAFEKGRQKGILLLGIPGIGKSLFAKTIAKKYELPTVFFNLAKVFGSLVGESEEKMDSALKIIEGLGESIVVIDEIDKAMAGMGSGGATDSGVSERVFGMLHTWLQDRKSKSFIIATANDIRHLPPSLFRVGRWNAVMFVDYYPTPEHYERLLNQYVEMYGLDKSLVDISPTQLFEEKWTGAEIMDLVEKADMLNAPLSQVIKKDWVKPQSITEPEKIKQYQEVGKKYPSAHTTEGVSSPKMEFEVKENRKNRKGIRLW